METTGIPVAKVSPRFLHGSSTSHTWPFSAVAELIDNAYDPDVAAAELNINVREMSGLTCLVFEDNGSGMDHEHLLKMLSFGYSEEPISLGPAFHMPTNRYGNGFKSGSMRLARDALVFTVCKKSAGIGFLSRSYIETIHADSILVPVLQYSLPNMEKMNPQKSRNSLAAILRHSPFKTEKGLEEELQAIRNSTRTGTKIILYNLKRLKDGSFELDFESDDFDIRYPEAHAVDRTSVYHRTCLLETAEYIRSLRKYCKILYLNPLMRIFIREKEVMNRPIFESLSQTQSFLYKPTWMMRPLKLTFGFARNTDYNKEEYGVMLYHQNRLIRPYEKLGYQKQPNDLGVGVIGVVEVDFLKPILNKQDLEKDEKYNATMSAIASTLNDYWNEQKNGEDKDLQETSHTDWTWVQCHKCQKWRRMPDDASSQSLPEQWFCYMNPDPTHNRCNIQQEPEDENLEEETPTSGKASKIQMVKHCKPDLDFSKESELLTKKAVLPERQSSQQKSEPSSSREKDPSIENMQKDLMEAQKQEKTHRKLIRQIQKEKKQLEQHNQTLLQEVKKLKTTNSKTAELLKLAASLTSGESPVSSTSDKGRKRKSSEQGESGGKRADIKIDPKDDAVDEEMLLAAQTSFLGSESCSSSDLDAAPFLTTSRSTSSIRATNVARPKSNHFVLGSTLPIPSSSTSLQKWPTKTDRLASSSDTSMTAVPSFSRSRLSAKLHGLDKVIDLTFEESLNDSLESEDIKPDVNKLNLAVERANSDQVKGSSQRKEDFVTHAKATLARDTNVKVEVQESTSKQKYELIHPRFKALQKNVHKLLGVLVEDGIDIGKEEDIEDTVVEMIRVTCAPVKKA